MGIRAQESLNRYNAVTREETFSRFGTTNYSHRISQDVFNFYPMYDWLFEDIWRANANLSLIIIIFMICTIRREFLINQ
mgnify:CR=1 FL=1